MNSFSSSLKPQASSLALAALVLCTQSGCQWCCSLFNVDKRPGIEYITTSVPEPVKEPMFQRPVAGTNLVKRWPARMGLEYGYAPWEKKNDATMVPDGGAMQLASGAVPPGGAAENAEVKPRSIMSGVRPASAAIPTGRNGVNQQAVFHAPVTAGDPSAEWSPRGAAAAGVSKTRPAVSAATYRAPVDGAVDAPVQPRSVRTRVNLPAAPAASPSVAVSDESTADALRSSALPDVVDESDFMPTPETESSAPPTTVRSAPAGDPEFAPISSQFGTGTKRTVR